MNGSCHLSKELYAGHIKSSHAYPENSELIIYFLIQVLIKACCPLAVKKSQTKNSKPKQQIQ